MKRLLLYVHFNKFNRLSTHVIYQLTQMRPLFSNVIFISNSFLSDKDVADLKAEGLIDNFLQRENNGFDFAAWRDGMIEIGFSHLGEYDSVTLMNDTCFGPLWDMAELYHRFEQDDDVDFWGMTNHRATRELKEHIQSYYLSFSKEVVCSAAFQGFWQGIQNFTDVQDVIRYYETQVTTVLVDAGFRYQTVFDTRKAETTGMLYPDFSYYNPTAILQKRVPFIKVKAIDANQHIAPYLFNEIERTSDYPLDKLVTHMSDIHLPDYKYLLGRKYLKEMDTIDLSDKKIAIHLHVFYTDLCQEFFSAFKTFQFPYSLYITTDTKEKSSVIKELLVESGLTATVLVTGNIGRDVLPLLKLKEHLEEFDYIGHFHTKKSKEADFWAGESWRKELVDMLVLPADSILANLATDSHLGLVIADIPSFFRYNKIVDAWNEHLIAPIMNDLWKKMRLTKSIDFEAFHTFVMSYGTFVWFKYEALEPLFTLELTEQDIPAEPLPQNSILHAIERLLVYIAWNEHYDFRIAKNIVELTPFIDNKLLNERGNLLPQTYVNFDHLGGIKGAFKYIFIGPARAINYILKRMMEKMKL